MSSNDAAGDVAIDVAAIQAQLQADRARLASEIGSRLSSQSPQKRAGGSTTNPFSMPGSSSQSSSSSSTSSLAFQHRPPNLGLGATPTQAQQQGQQANSQDRRLKGALLAGKRKRREEMHPESSFDESVDGDSKSAMLSNGKEKEKVNGSAPGASAKKDPFAQKKKAKAGRASEGERNPEPLQNNETGAVANGDASSNGAGNDGTIVPDMQGLSKSARKKLKKKLKVQAHAGGMSSKQSDLEKPPHDSTAAHVKSIMSMDIAANDDSTTRDLTPAQRAMHAQLSGARFRQLNETLYTTTSDQAVALVQREPETLRDYHDGFREQTRGWPQVPVRLIFQELEAAQVQNSSGQASKASNGKAGSGTEASKVNESLGRHTPGALVLDLGAGDGFLARWTCASPALSALPNRMRVLSYDLLDSVDGWVRGLDIARGNGLPLPGKSLWTSGSAQDDADDATRCVDVVVFCLALMAKNWLESILEASRVLRPGGELLIAEVSSRLTDVGAFIRAIEMCGFKLKQKDTSNTHFVRFDFAKKRASTMQTPFSSADERKGFVDGGAALLKPCIYKRR